MSATLYDLTVFDRVSPRASGGTDPPAGVEFVSLRESNLNGKAEIRGDFADIIRALAILVRAAEMFQHERSPHFDDLRNVCVVVHTWDFRRLNAAVPWKCFLKIEVYLRNPNKILCMA